jgi:hypothetical protein
MIDHISFSVNNFGDSLNFYGKKLTILGYRRLMTFDDEEHRAAGYGKNDSPSFCTVHKCYSLALGEKDNGAPR